MHSLRRGIVSKTSGIAAICAMLLLSFAPLASQLIAHSRLDVLLASFCASGTQAVAPIQKHANHDAHAHLQACGYCDLVAHAPTPPSFAHDVPSRAPLHAPYAIAAFTDEPHTALRRDALPRAPPAIG